MLKANKLTIEYGTLLFKDLSFTLGKHEKIGLIGLNGCGKSTLLKIIAGIEIPDTGNLEIVNEKIAYLPQEYYFEKNLLVGEVLEALMENPKTQMYKINKILNQLEFLDIDWFQEINTLSYGQKMKLYLAKLLYDNPTILLLDEPTNHLDIYGILWLEKFIQNFNEICIIVSHDREFLNSTVNKIFEIDEHKLNIFEGNYDEYIYLKQSQIEERRKEFGRLESKKKRFEKMIDIIKKMNSGEAQSRALKAAKTRMKREITDKDVQKYNEQKISGLNLSSNTKKKHLVLKIKDLTFGYNVDQLLLQNANLDVYVKDKIWFYGSNGIGKSTLIKLITEEISPVFGTITFGKDAKWAYFSQDQQHLDMEKTLEEYFLENTNATYGESFGILKKFLFSKEMRKMQLNKLSPGQRARLSFAIFAQHKYDLMILDEPTNHLDIKSKEIIENALKMYEGALILISHDRYFVKSLEIDKTLTIKDKQLDLKGG